METTVGTYVEIDYVLPGNPQSRTWSEWFPGNSADNGITLLAAGAEFYRVHPTATVTNLSTSVGE